MINLQQLLVENPDLATHRDNDYSYSSGRAVGIFSIFKDRKTNKWISAVGYRGEIKTSDSELNKIIDHEALSLGHTYISDDNYDDYSLSDETDDVHPNLLRVFENLKRLDKIKTAFEYRNARDDIPVNARVWKARDGKQYLVSFWSRTKTYSKYKANIDEALKLLKVDPKKCLYEFIEQPNTWLSYEQLNTTGGPKATTTPDEEFIQKMMKIQHLNPAAKKLLIKKAGPDKLQAKADDLRTTVASIKAAMGLDEVQNLQEDPDNIEPKRHTVLNYGGEEYVAAVVIIGKITINSSESKVANHADWFGYSPMKQTFWLDGKVIKINGIGSETHGDVTRLFNANFGEENVEVERYVNLRLFKYKDVYYAATWEKQEECKAVWELIKKCLDFLTGGHADEVKMQFAEQEMNEFIPFNKAFGIKVKRSRSDADIALAQQLHLMPPAQKAAMLKKMGAMKPNELNVAAEKLGMTTIELKQALGLDVAENSQGNVSFSDHGDPEIPYEAKPRPALTPSYGTVFERFTRRRTRFR